MQIKKRILQQKINVDNIESLKINKKSMRGIVIVYRKNICSIKQSAVCRHVGNF